MPTPICVGILMHEYPNEQYHGLEIAHNVLQQTNGVPPKSGQFTCSGTLSVINVLATTCRLSEQAPNYAVVAEIRTKAFHSTPFPEHTQLISDTKSVF